MKQVNVLATKRQAEAVRMLCRLLEEHAPRGENVRALMWPEIEIAGRLAMNIELACVEETR